MRTVQLELLRPDEVIREKKRFSVAYVPVGPLEWHGPHLPLGTDALNATTVAREVAERIGGVVVPTLYWGTETFRDEDMVEAIGFERDQPIVGMDFPGNSMPSYYCDEAALGLIVREMIFLLKKQGYRLVVIVNGHGATNHERTLKRVVAEYDEPDRHKLLYVIALAGEPGQEDYGHATRQETAIMLATNPKDVNLPALPPKNVPLKNTKFAIVDDPTFRLDPTADHTVRPQFDPRRATRAQGKRLISLAVEHIASEVKGAYRSLARRQPKKRT